ncbi:MAG: DUF998 domain-containing protein [Chitinophagaceae bacterium]|nr:DUF998 domain-containing protein [Chitinophagaceae bacterium]
MNKAILIILSLFLSLNSFSQQNLPSIKANSTAVDIRVDDDYFVKGGWTLDSTKKPDIFSIGSKWLYDSKQVTFITDIDSLSVSIPPNSKYDFIILLNGRTPCYIRIATLANPIFMSFKILVPLLIGIILFLLLLFVFRKKLHTRTLLYFGYGGPLAFWVTTFVSGYIHGNYNHFKEAISELGAIGTKSEIITSSLLMLIAVFTILFSIGFYRASRENNLSTIPALLSFVMPFTIIWAGIFAMGNEFHSLTGPLPVLLIIAFLLGYFLWKKALAFKGLAIVSLLCFFISALILLKLLEPFGYQYEGLIQRFFYLGWTIWTVSIAKTLSKK